MKKIIFLFLVLFSSILIVKADDSFYLGEKVIDMYVESIRGSDKHNGAPFFIHRSDGEIVYCINPFKMMSEGGIYKSYNYNAPIFKLTNEQLNKLNIIGYYGYGYSGHSDKKWYGITQYLMWKSLSFDKVYFTDSYYGSRVEKYVSEVNELENMVNRYLTLPSFAGGHYKYNPYTENEIIDTNNVLSNYEIKESNIEASIVDNKLKINANLVGDYNITFIRKNPIKKDYILYNLENHQELLYPGKIEDMVFSISIRVMGGSITINKLDSENKSRLEAKLEGSFVNLGKNNIWLSTRETNENGSVTFYNLAPGDYKVQEYRPSLGYMENIDSYTFGVKDGENIVYNVYEKVIKGNLIINKYYGNENNYKLDEDAVFEVYHNNNLIKTLKPINGIINEKLEYGTYTIKQISGTKYYDFAKEFIVSINENKNYTYNLYTEMEEDLKIIFDEKESDLNIKEEELNNLQNNLLEEKENLITLKNEILKEQEEIKELQKEIENDKNYFERKEKELIKLEEELKLLKNNLELEGNELFNLKQSLQNKEKELNDLKVELEMLKYNLKTKEECLNQLKNNLDNKKIEFIKKEKELDKEEKNVLIVEVPNTLKRSYNKLVSKILIITGSLLIIYNRKKVTHL